MSSIPLNLVKVFLSKSIDFLEKGADLKQEGDIKQAYDHLVVAQIFVSDMIKESEKKTDEDYRLEREAIMKEPKSYLGSFRLVSGKVMVSDPCYTQGTWCQHLLDNVRRGEWTAIRTWVDQGDWGIRVGSLAAYTGQEPEDADYELIEQARIGVDSGQAGIFDLRAYRRSIEEDYRSISEEEKEAHADAFYRECCDLTLSKEQAGILSHGVVSSSGDGDGTYRLSVRRERDRVTAIKIDYY